jgi:hypothetical protein
VAIRYLIDIAVITSPGLYRYELVSVQEARTWLHAGKWESRVGYGETARWLDTVGGDRV